MGFPDIFIPLLLMVDSILKFTFKFMVKSGDFALFQNLFHHLAYEYCLRLI